MIYRYQVCFESEEDDGYHAYVPALPGCHSYGATIEEAEEHVKVAIALYVDGLRKHKLPIPPSDSSYLRLVEVEFKPRAKRTKKVGAAGRP